MRLATFRRRVLVLAATAALPGACATTAADEPKPPVVVSTETSASDPVDADPEAARSAAMEAARSAGILGLLQEPGDAGAGQLATVFGSDAALGADLADALGGLQADALDEAYGVGGLGLRGSGVGGGSGEGIGLGSIGTIGHGAGTGSGQGHGSGVGRLGGSRAASPPTVRPGETAIQGSLPREVIQRIVRRHLARFRYCYERGLLNDPKLQGRVIGRFVIAKDGSVSSVQTSGDLPDDAVRECVRLVFAKLSFPAPDPTGIVTVSYPLVFKPSEPDPPAVPAPPATSTPSKPAPPPTSSPAAP